MIYIKDEGIIITKKPYKEKEAIVVILTKKYGKIKALATGLRRPQSRILGFSEPGTIAKFYFAVSSSKSMLSSNIVRLLSILAWRMPGKGFGEHPYLFLWALRFLSTLNILEISDGLWDLILTLDKMILKEPRGFQVWFILKILDELGEMPNFEHCQKCNQSLPQSLPNSARINSNESRIILKEESYRLMKLLFAIHNKLGSVYKEKNYQNAVEEILKREKIHYEREKSIKLQFENLEVSNFFADFVIDNKILLEIKAKPFITSDDIRQSNRYIKSLNIPLAIIANFKKQKLEYKRIINSLFGKDSVNSGRIRENIFFYNDSLYCFNCKKPSYESISQDDLLLIKKISRSSYPLFPYPSVLKKILKVKFILQLQPQHSL
jgi:GxxExxY protein